MTLAWCFQDGATPFTESVLNFLAPDVTIRVPAIWPLEVANALLTAERRKRVTTAQVTTFLQVIKDLPISVDSTPVALAFDRILSLAREQNLTEYDASYLELAIRESLIIATLDERLRTAAPAVGVKLFAK